MSKTKEYIDNLMEQGTDPFVDRDFDYEYEQFLEENYRQSLEEMNRHFMEHPEETENSKTE